MKQILVPRVPILLRAIDYAMIPIMFLLGGFRKDAIQETHPWHCFRGFEVQDIDKELAVSSTGTDSRSFKRHFLFLFHAPILGGWKDYIVLKPKVDTGTFFVGWIAIDTNKKSLIDAAVNKLPIRNGAVKLLVGPPNQSVLFFAVDNTGKQIALERVARGRLGDGKHPGVRLL